MGFYFYVFGDVLEKGYGVVVYFCVVFFDGIFTFSLVMFKVKVVFVKRVIFFRLELLVCLLVVRLFKFVR